MPTKRTETEQKDWQDWKWQMRHAMTRASDFEAKCELSHSEREGLERAKTTGLPVSVTPYYFSLIDAQDPNCPIRKQCIPSHLEADYTEGDLSDPLGEVSHEVAPYLVQRYPDRALLLVTDRCAVYCRFCTRSRMVGDGDGALSTEKLEPAFAYLMKHPEIKDVIVSGGDPLAMSTEKIVKIVEKLRNISHLDTIRLATRVPVTVPMRITEELVSALKPHHPLWLMTHFNHPKELTEESKEACLKLVDAGFPVMNQTVLMRGINDSADTLEELFRGLIKVRVKPYYLLQMDPVSGTGHLRTPLHQGMQIMSELQGKLTSIALPKFICDTPNGKGKVPVGVDTVVYQKNGRTGLRTFRGEVVEYIDPYANANE